MTVGDLQAGRVGVLGYGANHAGLVRFLAGQGVRVTVRDRNPAVRAAFEEANPDLGTAVSWEIGSDTLKGLEAFTTVFRSPSIPVLSPGLAKAAARGVTVYSQTRLFFDLCPCPIIGVTGTKGKGTASTLIHKVLTAGYDGGTAYLGGNIGRDPFEFYGSLTPDDLVVLELSSFQLQDLHRSPHIAVLLTVGKDHLDHHKTVGEYAAAKESILKYQKETDIAVVNVQQPGMEAYLGKTRGLTYPYSRHTPRRHSAWAETLDGKETIFVQVGNEVDSFDSSGRRLLGDHNLDNILPAAIVGRLLDIGTDVIAREVTTFAGLEHRLSWVGRFEGADFYDDSIATTPDAALVALEAFAGRRVHLIAGGNDKGGEVAALGEEIAARCATLSLLPGSLTPKLRKAVERASRRHPGCLVLDAARDPWFPTILSGISPHLRGGDVVLVSPAGSSFASFKDAKERGDLFVRAVRERYGKGEA